jgi:hypothetical protein
MSGEEEDSKVTLQEILDQMIIDGTAQAGSTLSPEDKKIDEILNSATPTNQSLSNPVPTLQGIIRPTRTPYIQSGVTRTRMTSSFQLKTNPPLMMRTIPPEITSNYSIRLIGEKPDPKPTIESFDVAPVQNQNQFLEKQIELSKQNNLALNQTADYSHQHYERLQYYNNLLFWLYLIVWSILLFVLFMFPSTITIGVRIVLAIVFLAIPFLFAYIHSLVNYTYHYIVALVYNRVFNGTLNNPILGAPEEVPQLA